MSTRFESANSEYAACSGLTFSGPVTIGGYFYLHSLPSVGNYYPLFVINGEFVGFWVGVNSSGRLVVYDYNREGFDSAVGATTLSTSTWYYLWGTMASGFNPLNLYLDTSTSANLTTANVAMPGTGDIEFATNEVGLSPDVDRWADISLCGWKLWDVSRAASNAAAESATHSLVSATSALGAWYFDGTDVTDHHTSGNDLTAVGTLSAGPDSPIDSAGTPAAPYIAQLWPRGTRSPLPTSRIGQLYPRYDN